jgi:L-asparaginase
MSDREGLTSGQGLVFEPRFLLLTTGGTIATLIRPDGSSSVALRGYQMIGGVEFASIRTEDLHLSPSWAFGPADMRSIALNVRNRARTGEWDGIVVTHGTSTMEYTAFLTDLFLDQPVPVVFTGSMRSTDHLDPDGPRNLRDSFRLAADTHSRELGVVLCLNGGILSARGAYKRHRTDVETFEDLQGPIGTVDDQGVVVRRVPRRPMALNGSIDESVVLIKAFPGADGRLIDTAVDAGATGVVIEAFPGVGGVPPAMISSLERWSSEGTVFVVSSRAPAGELPDRPTGGTGSPLQDLDLLSAGSLTSEKAWVLLMACLGQEPSSAGAKELFKKIAT